MLQLALQDTDDHQTRRPPAVGSLGEQARRLLSSGWVDELAVDGWLPKQSLMEVVVAGRQAGRAVRVRAVATDLPPVVAGERWLRVGGGEPPTWRLAGRRRPTWQVAVKRVLDIALAAALLGLASPVMAGLAIAVRLSSRGPVIYRWRVVGRNGRPFTSFKFRTMVEDADRMKPMLIPRNEMRGPVFKLADDPRLTPLGRWLRRYSLDELPQLWSVLTGDMSLVGPRPPLREEYSQFELWQMRKLSVTPGMTCLWQVGGRNAIKDFAEWARLDLEYIDHWSLRLDARILLQTLASVVRGTGC